MNHKKFLKNCFYALCKHLWLFIKRLAVFVFYWGMFAIISYGIAILVPKTLESKLRVSPNFCSTLAKILLTIAPLPPTLIYTQFEQKDLYEEYSMDLCFVVWILTIVWAWFL